MKRHLTHMLFCIACMLTAVLLNAQNNTDSLYKAFKDIRYPLDNISGKWIGAQGTEGSISIIDTNGGVRLNSIKELGSYHFKLDSSRSISAIGSFPHWPPYYCILNLKEDYTLEVIYFHFSSGVYLRELFNKQD